MKPDFFISHSKEVKVNFAIPIVQILSDLGFEPWIDRKEIASGEYIYQTIKEALFKADYCIAIIDSVYLTRTWTLAEIKYMHERELKEQKNIIIPIYVNIEKETVYQLLPWLEGRAFEKINNSKFDTQINLEVICRIVGRYFTDRLTESLDDTFRDLKEYSFPGKQTILILVKDKGYYSSNLRIAIIELSNIGGLLYGIYTSMQESPNFLLDICFNLCNLFRSVCFDTQYELNFNMYIALLKSVSVAATELKILLDSL